MGRERKWRAWNKIDKVMIYDLNSPTVLHGVLTHDPDDILMDYTGLKDKNGKEIYEKSIIAGKSFDFGAQLGVVELSEYVDNEEYVHYKHYGWNVRGIPLIDLIDDGLVVVGSTYENPELLEVKE